MKDRNVLAERRARVAADHEQASPELLRVHVTTEAVAVYELTPPHAPRAQTPMYVRSRTYLIDTLDSPCVICGVRTSTLQDAKINTFGAITLETHHYPVERSLMDACDPAKLHPVFPQIIDKETLEAFIDSPSNLIVLCLTGDTPVLMRGGIYKPLAEIQVGDHVISSDLLPHKVTAVMEPRYVEEDLVEIDGVKMTANHPVLTASGWKMARAVHAGEMVYKVKVMSSQMLGMIADKFKIFNPVVSLNFIDMVNAFSRKQLPTEVLFQDVAVLHHLNTLPVFPYPSSQISLWGKRDAHQSFHSWKRSAVEGFHAARVGAIHPALSDRSSKSNGCATNSTREGALSTFHSLFSDGFTFVRTGNIANGNVFDSHKGVMTNFTLLFNEGGVLAIQGWWNAVVHVKKVPFNGYVHDISVSHSHSFVTKDFVVHNCSIHHRSMEQGIHHLLVQDYAVLPYLYKDYQITASAKNKKVTVDSDDAAMRAAGLE